MKIKLVNLSFLLSDGLGEGSEPGREAVGKEEVES